MPRIPEIEKILDAWWSSEHCLPSERAESQKQLDELLDAVIIRGVGAFTRD
jgi:hypothetical protein